VIDSPQVVRAGIAMLINSQPDMEVVLEAGDATEALDRLRRIGQRTRLVALVGLGLTGEQDSLWLIRSLRDRVPSMPVLASGAHSDEMAISRALFMGADGFVDKDAAPEAFLDALRAAADGRIVLTGASEPEALQIAEGADESQSLRAEEPVLTERELEVLVVATEGLTSRQIGRRLGVRERTVTTHLSRIYKKLGAGSRVGAIAVAAQSGLVQVGPK
jgi:DNA-binding NarL/FixJ family response regulator